MDHPPEPRHRTPACRDTEDGHLRAVLNRAAADLAERHAGTFAPETVTELRYDSRTLLARIQSTRPPSPPGSPPTGSARPHVSKESW